MSTDAPLLAEAAGAGIEPLLYAVVLLLVGLALFVIEFFVVSFGVLTVAAVLSVTAAIYFAFSFSDLVGWLFAIATPLIGVMIVRWGLRRIRTSSMVPQTEITADAGYHHVAERLGIAVGSVGTLVTSARPSGRARFAGGECDVQVQGLPVEPDTKIVVKRIDGPIIFVVAEQYKPSSDESSSSK